MTTERANDSIDSLVDLLQQKKQFNVLFASPSAVDVLLKKWLLKQVGTALQSGQSGM